MEALIANLLEPGETIVVGNNGASACELAYCRGAAMTSIPVTLMVGLDLFPVVQPEVTLARPLAVRVTRNRLSSTFTPPRYTLACCRHLGRQGVRPGRAVPGEGGKPGGAGGAGLHPRGADGGGGAA